MRKRYVWLAALWILPIPVAAQAPAVITPSSITPDQEPHHHLVMENDFVKLFEIDVAPRDALSMHRLDHDEVSIAIGGATTVSTTPGQADILTISKPGDVSFARNGSERSVRNIGQTSYRAIAIDMLQTQTGARNLCAAVLAGQPLDCPGISAERSLANYSEILQFESNQTHIRLVRLLPHQTAGASDLQLIIALDPVSISPPLEGGSELTLHAGDYVWFDTAGPRRKFENKSDKEARFIELTFKPFPRVNHDQPDPR